VQQSPSEGGEDEGEEGGKRRVEDDRRSARPQAEVVQGPSAWNDDFDIEATGVQAVHQSPSEGREEGEAGGEKRDGVDGLEDGVGERQREEGRDEEDEKRIALDGRFVSVFAGVSPEWDVDFDMSDSEEQRKETTDVGEEKVDAGPSENRAEGMQGCSERGGSFSARDNQERTEDHTVSFGRRGVAASLPISGDQFSCLQRGAGGDKETATEGEERNREDAPSFLEGGLGDDETERAKQASELPASLCSFAAARRDASRAEKTGAKGEEAREKEVSFGEDSGLSRQVDMDSSQESVNEGEPLHDRAAGEDAEGGGAEANDGDREGDEKETRDVEDEGETRRSSSFAEQTGNERTEMRTRHGGDEGWTSKSNRFAFACPRFSKSDVCCSPQARLSLPEQSLGSSPSSPISVTNDVYALFDSSASPLHAGELSSLPGAVWASERLLTAPAETGPSASSACLSVSSCGAGEMSPTADTMRHDAEERERRRVEEEKERQRQEEEERERRRVEEEKARQRQEEEERERRRVEEEKERERQEEEERERRRVEEEKARQRQEEEGRERQRREEREEREREFQQREAELKTRLVELQREHAESVETWMKEQGERERYLTQDWERKLHAFEEQSRTVLLQERSRHKQLEEENAELKMRISQLSRNFASLREQLVASEKEREMQRREEEEKKAGEERDRQKREETRKEKEAFLLLVERDREELKKFVFPALSELQEDFEMWRQQLEEKVTETAERRRRAAEEHARLEGALLHAEEELARERREHKDQIVRMSREKEDELQRERAERRRLARELQTILRMQRQSERSEEEEAAEMGQSSEAIEARYFAAELQRCRSSMEVWHADKAELVRRHEERERRLAEEIQSLAAAGAEERANCDKLLNANRALAQELHAVRREMEKVEATREEVESKGALEDERQRERLKQQIFELQCDLQQREKENEHLRMQLRLLEEEPVTSPLPVSVVSRQPQPREPQTSPQAFLGALSGPPKPTPHLSTAPVSSRDSSPISLAPAGSSRLGVTGESLHDPQQREQMPFDPALSPPQQEISPQETPQRAKESWTPGGPCSRRAFPGASFDRLETPQEARRAAAEREEEARKTQREEALGPAASAVSVASAAAAVATSFARSAFTGAFFGRESTSLEDLQKHLKMQRENEERARSEREQREREEREQRRGDSQGAVRRETVKTGWEEDFDFDEIEDSVAREEVEVISAAPQWSPKAGAEALSRRPPVSLQTPVVCVGDGGTPGVPSSPDRHAGVSESHLQPSSSLSSSSQNSLAVQASSVRHNMLRPPEQRGETSDRVHGRIQGQPGKRLSTPETPGGWGKDGDFDFFEDESPPTKEGVTSSLKQLSGTSSSLRASLPQNREGQSLSPSLDPSAVRCGGALAPGSPPRIPLAASASPISSSGCLPSSLEPQRCQEQRYESGIQISAGQDPLFACSVGVSADAQSPVEVKCEHERRETFFFQETSRAPLSPELPSRASREETPCLHPTELLTSQAYSSGRAVPAPQVSMHLAAGGVHGGALPPASAPAREQTCGRVRGCPGEGSAGVSLRGESDRAHAVPGVQREPADMPNSSRSQLPPATLQAKSMTGTELHAQELDLTAFGSRQPRRLVIAGPGVARGVLDPARSRQEAVQDIDLEDFLNS
ncbi:non-specific serine/threonine protein kinase, partial [Toxoplasma gondii TgCatPRC2]